MSATDKVMQAVDAYIDAYDSMQCAGDLHATNRARAALYRTISAEFAAARNAAVNDGLTVAIQHLNSNPYILTKYECINLVRKVRDGVTK